MQNVFVLLGTLTAFAISAVSSASAEWEFYGSVRMGTFYNDHDFGDLRSQLESQIPLPDKVDRLEWSLMSTSRIGAKVQRGHLTGHFEYGSGPNLRHLYSVNLLAASSTNCLIRSLKGSSARAFFPHFQASAQSPFFR